MNAREVLTQHNAFSEQEKKKKKRVRGNYKSDAVLLLPKAKFKEIIICNKRLERGFLLWPLKNLLLESVGDLRTLGRRLSVA